MICSFCTVPAQAPRHDLCPGAIRNDAGKTWICSCGCVPAPRCIRCRSTEAVDPATWVCVDVAECDAAVERRVAANPVIAQLRAIRGTDITARAAQGHVTQRQASAVQGPKRCQCGCGAQTASKFAPGHDARLRGVLARAAAAGDADAALELAARGGLWASKAPGVAAPADPDAFIAQCVARRYEVVQ